MATWNHSMALAAALALLAGSAPAQEVKPGCAVDVTGAFPPVPTDVTGDTLEEFMKDANAKMGDGGHMVPDASTSYQMGAGKDGKEIVTGARITIKGSVKRPRLGMNRAKGPDLKLIQEAVKLIEAHEKRHRDIYLTTMKSQGCKGVLKRSAAQAEKAVDAALCKANKAQEALDKKEGLVVVVVKNGKNAVKLGPAPSASYPCN